MADIKSHTKLTALKVANLRPNPRKRLEVADAGKPGLYLVIQPNGHKSWAVRYRRPSDRTPRKLTLPGFPSLAVAHKLAQQALDRVADGFDPAAEKQAERRAPKPQSQQLEHAFRLFMEKHTRTKSGRPIRESTRRETARLLGFRRDPQDSTGWIVTGGGALARLPASSTLQSVRPADIRDMLDELVEIGPVMANRTLAALKTCFSFHARRDPDMLPRSPCEGIDDPSPEAERERALTDEELAAAWKAAEGEGYPFGSLVHLLILTGCRRDEVREAPWAEFDHGKAEWLIPGRRTKNGVDHLVPITDAMEAVLKGLPKIKGKAGLLLTTTGETPISGLAKYKRRLDCAVAKNLGREVDRWTLHDLRRTFVTGLQRLGFPLEVAEACVNHRSGTVAGVTGVYARYAYAKEKRAALEAWARHVDSVVTGKAGRVVPLRRRSR